MKITSKVGNIFGNISNDTEQHLLVLPDTTKWFNSNWRILAQIRWHKVGQPPSNFKTPAFVRSAIPPTAILYLFSPLVAWGIANSLSSINPPYGDHGRFGYLRQYRRFFGTFLEPSPRKWPQSYLRTYGKV